MIEQRQKVAEKRVLEFEKKKKMEEKQRYSDYKEVLNEHEEKRKRVRDGENTKDTQAYKEY